MQSRETVTKGAMSSSDSCSDVNSTHSDDDFEGHGPVFSIVYLLLKHLLLAILFLMIIFTLVRLPLIDDHLRHVILTDSLSTSTTTSPADERLWLQRESDIRENQPRLVSNTLPLEGEEERLFQRIKVIVLLARLVVILVILVGIIGIIREDVTCLLIFVLMSSFRLITTLYVPYFHNGFISSAILIMITLMSLVFTVMLIKRKKQLSMSTMNLEKSFPRQVIIDSGDKSQITCQREYNCSSIGELFNEITIATSDNQVNCKSIGNCDHRTICIINDNNQQQITLPISNLHNVPASPFSTLSTCSSQSFTSSTSSISGRKSCIPSRIAAAMSHSLSHHSSSTVDGGALKKVYK